MIGIEYDYYKKRSGDNRMEKFERLSRDLVAKGGIIDYYQDTIKVPNGNIVKWDFIKHKGAAAVIPVTKAGKVLMVRQYRNALDRDTIEIPAGGLNTPEEPTKEAALRELTEETGYIASNIELLITIRTTVAFCNEKIDIYVASNLVMDKQNLDENEFIDVEAFEIDDLIKMIYEGKIQDGKTVAGLMAYYNKFCHE